jgi:RHS repeat-associated protein
MTSTGQQASRSEACLASRAVCWPTETEPRNPQASYYRARYYDQNAGRFLSEDPIRYLGGDRNFYRYVWGATPNLRDPSGLLGMGLSLGAGGFLGGGPGVGGSASIGSMWFPFPGGHIQDVGGYSTVGGFAGQHGICKPYDKNQTGGFSASAGPGVVFSNGNSLADISGPFNNTSYTFIALQIDFAYSPDTGIWTLNLSPGFGLGFSKFTTNTYTNPTSPPEGCGCQ